MKMNVKSLIFFLTGVFMMASCSNEMEEQLAGGEGNGGQEVKFTTGIGDLSRTVIADGTLVTSFTEGDEMGVFAYKGDQLVAKNVKYTYNGSQWTSDAAITSENGVQLSYYAYYPYDETVTDPTHIPVTVNADQTGGFSKDDVLTAQNTTAEAGAANVSLNFAHAFAMVQVGIKDGLTTDTEAAVTLESIQPTAVVNAQDGSVGAASGETVSIKMKKTAEKLEYRAIVPAQELASGSKLLTVVAGGKTYVVTYSSTENKTVSYVKGKALQITVNSLNALPEGNEVTIGGSITDWESGTSNPGDEQVDRVYSDLIPLKLKDSSSDSFKFLTTDPKQANYSESFWFSEIKSGLTTTCELITDAAYGNVIKIDYQGDGSWYNNFVGYFNPNKENIIGPDKIYTLSFKAKADMADAQIWACIKLPTEGYFCSLETATIESIKSEKNQTFKNFTLSTEWTEFSCNFKFSLLGNASGSGNISSAYKEWGSISTYDYYIDLAPRSKNTTFYITDVNLIEKE